MSAKALPFNDLNGEAIYDGDTIEDLHGQRGAVQHDVTVRDPDYRWSVDFGRGSLVPIELVGMAVVKIDQASK